MIATSQTPHPSDEELIEFGVGRLGSKRFDQLLTHLDACNPCQQRLKVSSADDSFARTLNREGSSGDDPVLNEPDCSAALFHAAQLHVAVSPAMRLDQLMPPVETLGPYRLVRPLGRGGMGAVYLAEHQRLKKKCAIKLLPRGRGFDPTWVSRFEREMQAVAGLSHSGIVSATDAGDVDGWHYMVMEYLEGLDLAAIVRRLGRIDIVSAAAIMRDVCRALTAIHEAGLVHRDIKPSNIMLTRDGTVKLLDLGLVLDERQAIADMWLTTVGHVIGTLVFAAPEQLTEGQSIDSRADLYGVGATLFQLIAGQPAHTTDRGIAPLVIDKTSQSAMRLSSVRDDVPKAIDDLVDELLRRDPAERPASASDVADRLGEVAGVVSLGPLVRRAMRVSDPDSMLGETSPVLGFAKSDSPPPSNRWPKYLAFAGAAAIVAATVIVIQTKNSRVRIETDAAELSVQLIEDDAKKDVTNEAAKPEKLFKGEPLSHWTNILMIERDVDTLGEAMNAVASLVDAGDVDAVGAILISARRFGGLASSSDKTNPSQWYMEQFSDVYPRILPQPGIDAIAKELPIGNENSRLACLIAMYRFGDFVNEPSTFFRWAGEPENRVSATALHRSLQSVEADDGPSKNPRLRDFRHFSLALALALDAPLDEEFGLREFIEEAVAWSAQVRDLKTRLNEPWVNGKPDFSRSPMNVHQFIAAVRMGIELPASLDTFMLLNQSAEFREQRNEMFLERLKSDPQTYADEAVLWLHTTVPAGSMVAERNPESLIRGNESPWLKALPIVVESTTRPDIAQAALERVARMPGASGGTGGGMGGTGGGGFERAPLSQEMQSVVDVAFDRTIQRANEMPEFSEPTPSSADDPFGPDASRSRPGTTNPFGD